MKLAAAALALGALVAVDPRPADACSFAPSERHELDAAHASDATPPNAPTAIPTVRRWEYPSSCFDIGMIDVQVGATDNASPADRIGFKLRVLDGGDPPDGLGVVDYAVQPAAVASDGSIGLFFNYRDTEFAFELEVRAVDLNGNLGPPTVIFIADEPDTEDAPAAGCSARRETVASTSHAIVSLLTLISLLIALRPRR